MLLGGQNSVALAQSENSASVARESAADSEIIVTAQRRAQRLEEVPAAISYISADTLQNSAIVSTTDLPRVVPGLSISKIGAYTLPTLRGVGSSLTGPGLENNVATYVDGIYYPSTQSNLFELVDIENIQVLKGPQGALYGRNATGGAIIITTREPSPETHLDIRVGYARFDDRKVEFSGSAGLGAGMALGLSAAYHESDGFVRNIADNTLAAPTRSISVRPKIKLDSGGPFTALLTLEYNNIRNPIGGALTAYKGNVIGRQFGSAVLVASRPYEVSVNFNPIARAKTYGVFLRSALDLGAVTLTSYTGFRSEDTYIRTDLDGSTASILDFEIPQKNEMWSEDLSASIKNDKLEAIAGIFLYQNTADSTPTLFQTPLSSARVRARSVAFYFDGTYHLTDRFSIGLGGRYSIETPHLIQRANIGTPVLLDVEKTFRSFTPRAVARYEVTPEASIYASYSEGFKSGLFAVNAFDRVPVKPEENVAYEVGMKFAQGSLRFDLSAFYYRYKNLQTTAYDLLNQQITVVQNAGAARIKGIEGQFSYSPVSALNLRLSATYLHARYKEFPNAEEYCPTLVTPPQSVTSCLSGLLAGGNTSIIYDAKGQGLAKAPDFTASAGVDYMIPVADGQLTLSSNLYYTSKVSYSPSGRLNQGAYALLGLRGTWASPDDKWSLSVFGDNVTGKKYAQGFIASVIGDLAYFGAPATYGVSVRFKM
jgi:iron complex outermembrane receptor protein